ncbi:MAG: hypothetical protein AAB407_00350 [Patescibacteria group bacterium]
MSWKKGTSLSSFRGVSVLLAMIALVASAFSAYYNGMQKHPHFPLPEKGQLVKVVTVFDSVHPEKDGPKTFITSQTKKGKVIEGRFTSNHFLSARNGNRGDGIEIGTMIIMSDEGVVPVNIKGFPPLPAPFPSANLSASPEKAQE